MGISKPSSDDASFRDRLSREIEEWRREGLVQPEQAQGILARYGLLPGETPRTLHRSRIVSVVALLGSILVGVGVILLIGSNWEHLPKWFRLALLTGATAGSYHAGYIMRFQSRKYPKVGMALLLLGSLLWGASIFLIGQMYHMGSGGGERKAVLYWLVGVLPLAYVLLSPLHLALSLVIGSVWLGIVLSQFHRLPPQAYLLVALALGIVLHALGRLHSRGDGIRRLQAPYCWFGLVYMFVALYVFSYQHFWDTCFRSVAYSAPADMYSHYWPWLGLLVVPGIAAVIGLFVTQQPGDRVSSYEAGGLAFLLLSSFLGIVLTMTAPSWIGVAPHSGWQQDYPAAFLMMGLFNLVLLGAAVGVIALGWARNEPGLANLGLFVFFVQVVTRYFDLLGTMLSSGFMFLGAGLLLLIGGAALERSRRRLLEAMALRRAP
ncbi:MAG: DUF2157 domain-containing protein [Armatimonadota bacterium]|nr:MAG: DUF2157 domain-containing protein [Armatimonadota bacterium]